MLFFSKKATNISMCMNSGSTVLMHFLDNSGNKRMSQISKLRNEEAMVDTFAVSIDFVFILN